jgi:DNA-binding response OmpR family regulator
MSRRTILVVEDEPDIAEVIQYNLVREGYRVDVVGDGEHALERIVREAPDLVLLDLMLPGLDGLELCRRMKEDPVTRPIPVIMVTAKGEESEVVLGLGVGADDYMAKPFSPRELTARVRAVLRRGPVRVETTKRERVAREGLVVDAVKHEVRVDGDRVTFTATEFRLLHLLASHPGRAFTRDELLSRVIGEHATVTDRNIDVHVRTIRQKLGPRREMIETVRGVGYRFREEE